MAKFPRIELALKAVATLIAVFGVCTYFFDRGRADRDLATERSLAFIRSFGDKELLEARGQMLAYWHDYPEFIEYAKQKKLTRREYENFIYSTYPKHRLRPQIDKSLFRIQVFFDELAYCHSSGICDRRILESYFCNYTINFSEVYGAFYKRLSEDIGSAPFDDKVKVLYLACKVKDSG